MNIIWEQLDGTLAVTSIFDGSDPQAHAAALKEHGNIPLDWDVVAVNVGDDQFPHEWPVQEDWRFINGLIEVDMGCAYETTRNRLREERTPLFAALDVQFQRALETGADTSAIVAEKERLRNITDIPAGLSLDALKALTCK